MKIIGAGLSGLLCGAMNPGSIIYEAQKSLPNNHGAILRFRDDKISKALNIPFKKVRVHKNIFYEDQLWSDADIQMMNKYSKKVTGEYGTRSIGDCSAVTRYIAPDDFIQQLADRCVIRYNCEYPDAFVDWDDEPRMHPGPYVSTIPMPIMLKACGAMAKMIDDFKRQPIWTMTYEFGDVNLYQTIYFPGAHTYIYRASFTGSKLIVETTKNPETVGFSIHTVLQAFGLSFPEYTALDSGSQEYGKIIEFDPEKRRTIIAMLSHKHDIYSLGRYATWRNILLDDVFDDIRVIQRLMRMDEYSHRIESS